MTNFSKVLSGYKKAIDKELEIYFVKAIGQTEKKDALIAEALTQTQTIALSGGKRIRGALLCAAYFGFGGKEKKKILKVAAAIELMHLFLLVHDDVIDRGQLRHGQMTLQEFFAKKYAKKNQMEAEHFGNSMAIVVGDLLYAEAQKMILTAGFTAEVTNCALAEMQNVLSTTIIGQSQDISIAYNEDIDENQVLSMYKNKTAKYTFEGPLHLGAILAGCNDKKTLQCLSAYAIPLGIAFQIQDDILGVFENTGEIGKSSASDIEEGKKTLMVVKAQELATKMQKKQLGEILGKKQLTASDIKNFQTIIVSSGALTYCADLAKKHFAKGEKEIAKIVMLAPHKNFLVDLVLYLEQRKF